MVRNWAKFVQSWITSWHLRQELKGRVKINFQKWATYFTSKTRNAHDHMWWRDKKKGSKYNTGAGTLVWDFLPIFEGKRFEGLGSLGSGRCGAALPGNCCHTKTLPSPCTPLAQLSIVVLEVRTCTSPYISAPVGCIKSISGVWGWMRLGLVRMSTSSGGPNLPLMEPLHDEVSPTPLYPFLLCRH